MRLGKQMRTEKRVPALSLLVSAACFIALFLVAVWVFSAPSTPEVTSIYVNTPSVDSKGKASSESVPVGRSSTDNANSQSEIEKNVEPQEGKQGADQLQQSENVESYDPEDRDNSQQDLSADAKKLPVGQSLESKPESKEDESKPLVDTVNETQLELGVENKESQSSTLISQAIESKVEIIQERNENEGVLQEKIPTEQKENTPTGNSENVPGEKKEESVDTLHTDSIVDKPAGDGESQITQSEAQTVLESSHQDSEKKTDNPGLDGSTEAKQPGDGNAKYNWKICKWENAADYIPCLDNTKAIAALKTRKHFEHRERHCPTGEEIPTCLVPLPEGYKTRVQWPQSRDQIWYSNVPHPKLVSYKQDQNWVKQTGDLLVFPGGGTQFKHGAIQYIESVQKLIAEISWGKHVRLVLDVGCGVASFGGYLFDKDVLTMSIAPKDEHDAQIQMALERGIPAFVTVMGTQRLVFPSNVYDVVHCARCRVPWHLDGGSLLLELNRLLRPGGYFVWSATPVYRKNDPDEVKLWEATKAVTDAMCWELLVRTTMDTQDGVGVAIFQKPIDNSCYDTRSKDEPPMCPTDDKADAAWYVKMNACIHRIPTGDGVRATEWPADWPQRIEETPKWLSSVPRGLYGKPAAEEFSADTVHWKHVIEKSYLRGITIDWSRVRNIMEMKAGYGGFAAALASQPVWVMNVVPTNEPDTLPIIFDRGLFGLYHDWCESFSTYPRTYDLLHSDHLFNNVKKRCGGILNTLVEMDRILRPQGWAIFRDKVDILNEIEDIVKSLHWKVHFTVIQDMEQLIVFQKETWRPDALA